MKLTDSDLVVLCYINEGSEVAGIYHNQVNKLEKYSLIHDVSKRKYNGLIIFSAKITSYGVNILKKQK